MSLVTHVPADVDPADLADLLHDCREVSGVLGTPAGPAAAALREPLHAPVIDLDTVAVLEGWGAYGS